MTDLPAPESDQGPEQPDPASVIRSRQFVVLLVLASIVGVIASVAAWAFLELIYYAQVWVFTDIPNDLGYDSAPIWWSLPILAIAGAVTALAIDRLPGQGGHEPSEGLVAGTIPPVELPGVLLAAVASIGLGIVLGPEAPLMALGGGIGFLTIRALRKDSPPAAGQLPGFEMSAAVAVCVGAAVVAVLRLPVAATILAAILAMKAGSGAMPLVIVGIAAAYLTTLY
ncbi:MAG: chloride channel protein, partial [Thermoleophilia bacterium]|nr:chloride channel protein [Thermoleophilia bacterium]